MPDTEQTPSLDRYCLIAGGGIGGLSAALFLAEAGWHVTLCDRETSLQEVGAGLQLSPNATRLLEPLGLLDDLDDIAVEPNRLIVHRGQDGSVLKDTSFGPNAVKRFGAPFLVVHRGDLHHALLKRVKSHPAITLRLGMRLSDIRTEPHAITGLFETPSGDIERISADLLIGADGLWSRARALTGLPAPSRYSGKTAWRTLIPREQAPLFAREAEVHLWLGPDAHLVHYPVRGGREINVVAIIEDNWREEGWSSPGSTDVITARFRSWNQKARDLIHAAQSWNRWALLDRAPESHWSRPRMTLLGDAAHPMMPFLAQGASQAIEDAFVLGEVLKSVRGGAMLQSALARYETIRIRRTARIQNAAQRQAKIYHLDGPMARIRDVAMRVTSGDMLLSRYDWIYGHKAEASESLTE